MGEGGDDFGGGGFADFAVAVVDAALRESVFAAASAGFGVEFVERGGFLLGCEPGEIDAGKFAGAFGVFQKNLAGVLESFHFDVADGEAEERTDFRFVQDRIAQTFVFLHDAAFGVEHERSGKRGNAAVLEANFVAGNGHWIVDAELFNKFLDGVLIVIVHHEAENLEAVLVFVLEFDEIGYFGAARSTPGGPEIQQNDFAFGASKCNRLAVEAGQFEVRRGIGVADETDGRLFALASRERRKETQKQRDNEGKN